ncbi:MAG: PEP-CTERM sorting domain-containing protein [Opitutales bacterium]
MRYALKSIRRLVYGLLLLASLSGVANAAISVTVTALVNTNSNSGSAFSVGETVTVTFTTVDGLGAPNLENSATNVHWETTNDSSDFRFGPLFWSDITVSGTSGSYSSATSDHTSWLESGDRRNAFYAAVWEDGDNGFGLFKGGEEINFIDAFVEPASLVPAVYGADSSVTPETTFFDGNFDVSGADTKTLFFYTNNWANEYIATIDTITITGAAIPEPSSAFLVGLGVFCLGALRRRR